MSETEKFEVKIGKTLKALRKQKKLTQKEVAEFLSITTMSYSRYEQDLRQPDFEALAKLAVLFQVDIGELFFNFISRIGNEYEDKYEYRLNKDYFEDNENYENLISIITQKCRIERRTAMLIERVNTIFHGGKALLGELDYLEKQLKNQFKEYKGTEEMIENFGGYIKFDDEIIRILKSIQDFKK
ncbi:helix-turn-helix transcriptional regulator [Mycoplasmatota bacterium WC30]